MITKRYSYAFKEVLEYLKGIRKEDYNKIPKKFIEILEQNASKDYIPKFDNKKALNELDILDETRGIISMLCLNYWCENSQTKKEYIEFLNQNEMNYQNVLKEKYNYNKVFETCNNIKNNFDDTIISTSDIIVIENKSILKKIIKKIKNKFNIKK